MEYTQLLCLIWCLLEVYFQTGLSQNCFSRPNCQGDNIIVQPGTVARDCCVGTDEGMSFSEDDGTNCTVPQCIVHGFSQTSYSVIEGEISTANFELNTKGTSQFPLTVDGNITARAVTARPSDFGVFVPIFVSNSANNIQVQTIDDDITLEYEDTIRLTFTPVVSNLREQLEAGGEFIRDTTSVVIIDNDVLTIRFTESEYSVTEGSSVCSGIMIQFRRTQNQFTLRLSAASIQEFEDMFNLSSFIDSGSIEEDARADPRTDFSSQSFSVTIMASEDSGRITYQLPNNFLVIDDNVNEITQSFAVVGELGDDVRDSFARFQRQIGDEQGYAANRLGATRIRITDNDRLVQEVSFSSAMIIGFAQRRHTVSESEGDDRFFIPINFASLRTSEIEYFVRFRIQTIGQTATVVGIIVDNPDFDAAFGSRNSENELIDVRSLPVGTRQLRQPLAVEIINDFTPEIQECFTVRFLVEDYSGMHSNYQCNGDSVNTTNYFCEHTICIDDDDDGFFVAFVETVYTVVESEGQVEVCVNLTRPMIDILDEFVYVDVFNNESSIYIPPYSVLATPDPPIFTGTYRMEQMTDFAEQTENFNAIVNMQITEIGRVICFLQPIYNDMRLELAEYAGLQLKPRNLSPFEQKPSVSSVLTLTEPMRDNSALLILDDDTAIVGLERTFCNVSEDVGVVEVCAIVYSPNITCPIQFPFDFNLSTSDNTAVIPMDYGAPSTVLMFAACETRSCVNVTIVDDLVDELEEILNVTLERTPGLDSRITLYPVDGQIVIIDNDVKNTVGYEFTVFSATEGLGQVELCAVIFDPPSGGAPRQFDLSITTENGTAASPEDYGAVSGQLLQFNQGDTSRCHTILINQDEICENNPNEDFFSSLAPVNDIQPITVVRQHAQVIINDFCMAMGLERTFYNVSEDVGVAEVCAIVYSPNITCPIAFPFNVSISTSDNTAVIPMDYEAPSTVLMFTACEIRSCVNVTIVDDVVDELEEIFDVTLERTPGLDSRIRINPADGQILIIDNDDHTNTTSTLTPTETEHIFPTPTAVTPVDPTSASTVRLVTPTSVSTADPPTASTVGLVTGVTVSVGVLILGVIVVTVFIMCWKSRADPKWWGTHCFTWKTKSDIETSPDEIEISALPDDMSSTPNMYTVRQSTLVKSTLVESTLEQQLKQELSEKNMIFSRKQIELSNVVGQGESGLVYRGYYDGGRGRELVAVKTCKALSTTSEKEKLLKEMTTMLSFTHPNVMSLIGLCFDGEMPLLIMPFMANGNVLGFVKKNKKQLYLSQEAKEVEVQTARRVCLDMCHQISKGMEYLAKQKFVHRDLAARNCMIDEHGVIKVADFGLTEDTYGANYFRRRKSVAGSEEKVPIRWMAPESIENDMYNESTDVWAFGVTCWEIFTCGRVPYAGIPTMTLVGELCNGHRLDRPSNAACSDEIWDIVMSCWCEQSQQRPKFTTLVKDFSELLDSGTNYLKLSQI